jgi:hypothetical protein
VLRLKGVACGAVFADRVAVWPGARSKTGPPLYVK